MRDIITFLLFININIVVSQNVDCPYIVSTFLADKNGMYTKGLKWVNSNNQEFSAEGYYHRFNFYFSKFNLHGKKDWEIVIDKKRHCEQRSELHKHNDTLYALIAVDNFKGELSIHYRTHFLMKFDSLGKILKEKKINDSIPHIYNSSFFANDFIYIISYKDKVICEKYDYNFNLIDSTNNDLLINFLYGSNVFKTRNNYLAIGPVNNMDIINKHVQNKTLGTYAYIKKQDCIKRMGVDLTKEKRLSVSELPSEYYVSLTAFDHDVLYLLMKHSKSNSKYRLLAYKEEKNEIQLLTDTISRSLSYFKSLADDEYLFITSEIIERDDKTGVKLFYPCIIYYIKNSQVITRFELTYDKYVKSFHLIDKKLLIFKNNQINNTMLVRTFDYEKGKFIE